VVGYVFGGAKMAVDEKQRLLGLQALRAFAAGIVALGHVGSEFDSTFGFSTIKDLRLGFFHSGVDVFFVLSGFVMVYVSSGSFGRSGYSRDFLIRRIARIAPIYWFYTSVMVAVILIAPSLAPNSSLDWVHVAASYLFWPYRSPDGALGPIYGVGWTLLYEMMFYVVFAGLVWMQKWRAVLALCLIFVALFCVRLLLISNLPTEIEYWSSPIVFEFAAGAILGALFTDGLRLPRWMGLALAATAFLLWFAGDAIWGETEMHVIGRVLKYGIPSALLVAAATIGVGHKPTGFVWPRWIVLIGDSSYSLYLSHFFSIGATLFVLERFNLLNLAPWPVWFVLTFGVAVATGYISYLLIERPTLSLTRGWGRRSAKVQRAAS
jgi:exopolysaccharide production protein ExoZ